MRLDTLFDTISATVPPIGADIEVTGVQYDSRQIAPGDVFVAIGGLVVDGIRFIGEAEKRGAVAIVTEHENVSATVPVVVVPDARRALAQISDVLFDHPQGSLIMTAVTGTNGKTTTAYMVKSIFEAGGMSCGLMGTITHEVGGEQITSVNTTPESRDIHALLAQMVNAGQHACVMEVSSHALSLSRVYGIQYRAVAFTNITRDHLDFHGTFEAYLEAKSILFSTLSGDSTAVVNLDDPHARDIIAVSRGGKLVTYGFDEHADIHPVSYELSSSGTVLELATPQGTISCTLPIPGTFNISNAMAAAGIGLACGCSIEMVARGLEQMQQVRGRFELIDEGQPFTVIIDYAHTPDALERILTSAREISSGRLISVFGCGGDRDRGKRPEMGRISAELADMTFITSDNPRSEQPERIIDDIAGGIPDMAQFKTFVDREEGIMQALKYAGPEDTVVIAGKGHEDYQIIGEERLFFDDAESVRRLIRAMEWKATHCNGC